MSRISGKRVRLGLTALVLVGAAVAIARVAIDARSTANALPTELRLARAEGLAVEPSDLRLAIAPDENAAPLYERAIAAFDRRPYADTNRRLEALGQFLAEGKDTDMVRSSLQKWSKSIGLAEEASRKPRCDFETFWQEGPSHEPQDLKPFVKLLGVRATVEDRLEDLEAARRIAEHAGSLPTVASAISRVEAQKVWLNACWRYACAHASDPLALANVRHLIGKTEYPYLHDCLRGELVLARARIRRLTFRAEENPKDLDPAAEAAGGMGQNDVAVQAAECRLIQLYRRLNAALPEDPRDWDGFVRAEESISKTLASSPSASLNPYLLPNLVDAAKKCKRLEERASAIDAALDRLINTQPARSDPSDALIS